GVYVDVSALEAAGRPLYAVEKDIEKRGLSGRLPESVHRIGYDDLVDLIVENKVVNFA
ncbi:MAG: DsrH/TusB family sulfur metabolism protein, partial [Dehalococcoidia bacterium]